MDWKGKRKIFNNRRTGFPFSENLIGQHYRACSFYPVFHSVNSRKSHVRPFDLLFWEESERIARVRMGFTQPSGMQSRHFNHPGRFRTACSPLRCRILGLCDGWHVSPHDLDWKVVRTKIRDVISISGPWRPESRLSH